MNRFGVLVFVLFSGFLLSNDKSSWEFYESEDVIDGYWSVVTGIDPKGRTIGFYDSGALYIQNGDNYICADAKGDYDKLKVVFKIDEEQHFYQQFKITDDRSALYYKEWMIKDGYRIQDVESTKDFAIKPRWGNSYSSGLDLKKFANKLKESNQLFLRTYDGCGKEVSMLFDLKGFTKVISNIYE